MTSWYVGQGLYLNQLNTILTPIRPGISIVRHEQSQYFASFVEVLASLSPLTIHINTIFYTFNPITPEQRSVQGPIAVLQFLVHRAMST